MQLRSFRFREGGNDSICVQILDCQGRDASMYFMFETRSTSSEVGGWVQLRPSWFWEGGRDSIYGLDLRLSKPRC